MEKPTCGIMQDLLISYCDGLTSEGVAQMLQEHLENCSNCMNRYHEMKQQRELDAQQEQIKENSFWNKLKGIRSFILGVLIGLVLPIGLILIWFLGRCILTYIKTMLSSFFIWG